MGTTRGKKESCSRSLGSSHSFSPSHTLAPSLSPSPLSPFRSLSLSLLVLLFALPPAPATPFSPDDNFVPACGGKLLPDPPPGGWRLWSSPATWGGSSATVPGVNSAVGANVTIPCNVGILLDLPLVQLTALDILGSLKFKDDPSLPQINLTAAFIIVEGRFIIGTPAQQFTESATILLTPNPKNRTTFQYTSRAPADPTNPRDLGHKVLAVVGGQVDFHGLPGSGNTPSWTKLAASANAGDSAIVVNDDVSSWPVGAQIVMTSTDYSYGNDDVALITGVTSLGGGQWRVTLDRQLAYNHFGDSKGVGDGFGGYVDEVGEVALLRRNILVTGSQEGGAFALEGGHFIVFMTNTRQFIEGVQFDSMGQQGHLGRYPIHFHVCGDQNKNSVIRRNLITRSKQRCVVIHATFNALVEENVAHDTQGHCFMVEDGSETGNTFLKNLGIRTRTVDILIPGVTNPLLTEQTDNLPATFWVTNPNNSLIGNVAAGSDDSGFWFQFRRFHVRGLSKTWAKVNSTVPNLLSVLGTYANNSAHSNINFGLRFYPEGYYPDEVAFVNPSNPNIQVRTRPKWVTFGGFNFWKNIQMGAQLHNIERVAIVDSTFADNTYGAHIMEAQGVNVSRSRFVGLSSNHGNPTGCQNGTTGWLTCGPINGCGFPLPLGTPGRSVAYGDYFFSGNNKTNFGVVFTESREIIIEDGSISSFVTDSTFANFDATCRTAAAVAVGTNRESYWNAGNGVANLTYDAATNPAFLYPWMFQDSTYWNNAGEAATFFAIRDLDGSLIKSTKGGGFLVADNPKILPGPGSGISCTRARSSNGWACPGACYRTVQISFPETGFLPYQVPPDLLNIQDGPRRVGDYAYLLVKRVSDGSTLTVEGNLRAYVGKNKFVDPPNLRVFPMSLLGGQTYEVTFVAGRSNPGFVPPQMTAKFKDGAGCGQWVNLVFMGSLKGKYSWEVDGSGNSTACSKPIGPAVFRHVCNNSTSTKNLQISMNANPPLQSAVPIAVNLFARPPLSCSAAASCGVVTFQAPVRAAAMPNAYR